MPEPRSKASQSRRETAPAKGPRFDLRRWLDPIWPDRSRRGMARLATRLTLVALTITIMTALADWSARGFLDRGGLDRLISMKPPVQPETRTALKPDRNLDKGRLRAILAADKR